MKEVNYAFGWIGSLFATYLSLTVNHSFGYAVLHFYNIATYGLPHFR